MKTGHESTWAVFCASNYLFANCFFKFVFFFVGSREEFFNFHKILRAEWKIHSHSRWMIFSGKLSFRTRTTLYIQLTSFNLERQQKLRNFTDLLNSIELVHLWSIQRLLGGCAWTRMKLIVLWSISAKRCLMGRCLKLEIGHTWNHHGRDEYVKKH